MNVALPAGTITAGSLGRTATALGRCTPELAALGPPAGLLRPEYRMARRACAAFEQGASYAVAAQRVFTTASPSNKLTKLLNQLSAAVSRGIILIAKAYYSAPFALPGS